MNQPYISIGLQVMTQMKKRGKTQKTKKSPKNILFYKKPETEISRFVRTFEPIEVSSLKRPVELTTQG